MGRHIFHYIRLLKAPSQLTLNSSKEAASKTSLGILFQWFTTRIVKNFFLLSNLNLPSFTLKPLPLVLSLQVPLKSLSPFFLWVSLSTERLRKGVPRVFSSPGWKISTLSAFLHRTGIPSLLLFLWPSSGPALTGPHLSRSRRSCRCVCQWPGLWFRHARWIQGS